MPRLRPRIPRSSFASGILFVAFALSSCGGNGPSNSQIKALALQQMAKTAFGVDRDNRDLICLSAVIDSCIARLSDKAIVAVKQIDVRQRCANLVYESFGSSDLTDQEQASRNKCSNEFGSRIAARIADNTVIDVVEKEPLDDNYRAIVSIRQRGNDNVNTYRLIMSKTDECWEVVSFNRTS